MSTVPGTAGSRRDGGTREARVLSSTQLAILGAEVWSPDPSVFTVVSAVRVKGVPDWGVLADAVETTLSRHDIFTWQLDLDDAYKVVATGGPEPGRKPCTVEQVDLSGLGPGDAEAAVRSRLARERRHAITLLDPMSSSHTKMIMFRFGGDRVTAHSGICALVTHHAFIDEHSTDLVWNEIFRRTAGRDVPDTYDQRYADWAAASVSGAARAVSQRAAAELVHRLRAEPLGSIGVEQHSGQVEVTGSPLRFAIPERLGNAAASRAHNLELPPSAVYAGAWTRVLCARATAPRLAVTTQITRRRGLPDADVVGCYVGAVPVLVEAAEGDSPETVIRQWHRSLAFSHERDQAGVDTVQRGLDGVQRFSLTFETRSSTRTVKPIVWKVLPPPDSHAKSSLSLFLSFGGRWGAGDGRLLWRAGVLDLAAARRMVADFLDALALFTEDPGGPHVGG